MRWLVRALVGASLAVAGCGPVPANDKVDGWALTRGALTSGTECFAGRPEYCITDPEFVDAAIRPRLDDLYGGEMPMKRLKVEGTIRTVARNYRRALMTPESIARVEELVKERYATPKITRTADEIALDMGVVPGRLEGSRATLSLRMTSSRLAFDGLWAEDEAQRVLSEAASSNRDKSRVRVTVLVPAGSNPATRGPSTGGLVTLVYRYSRLERCVVVTDSDGNAWSSRRFDGEPASLATLALSREDLSQCSLTRSTTLDMCPLRSVD